MVALKKKRLGWKESLVEAIVPVSGTQSPVHLWKDGALPCKVVIISIHALRHIPKGFLW